MAGTTLAQGSSVTLTVVATDSLLIDGARSASAIVEAVSGVQGSANRNILVNHPGGQAVYGPFGAGTIKLSAIGGDITYVQGSTPLIDEPRDVFLASDGTFLASRNGNILSAATVQTVISAGKSIAPFPRGMLEFLPSDSLTPWTEQTQTGSGATFQVDSAVTINGRSTIRVDFPANYNGGAGGTVNLGTLLATADIPYNWDRDDMAVAIRTSVTPVASHFQNVFLGDATYTNYYLCSTPVYSSITTTHLPRANEWIYFKMRNGVVSGDDFAVGAGSPSTWLSSAIGGATAPKMRARVRLGVAAGNAATSIWVGFFGKLPKRRPTLVMCFDDGYSSWYTLLRNTFKHFNLPVSLGIASALANTGGFMTSAQIQQMATDPRGLFDFVNHSTTNDPYSTLGAAAYYANVETCKEFLRSIGIAGDGPLHHPYVQNSWGNDLVDLLIAGGYKSARAGAAGTSYAIEHKDQAIPFEDKQRWRLPTFANLNNSLSLAQAKAAIDDLILRSSFGMMTGHDFGSSAAGAQYWNESDLFQLLGYIKSKQDDGTLDVTTWSNWYASVNGSN